MEGNVAPSTWCALGFFVSKLKEKHFLPSCPHPINLELWKIKWSMMEKKEMLTCAKMKCHLEWTVCRAYKLGGLSFFLYYMDLQPFL